MDIKNLGKLGMGTWHMGEGQSSYKSEYETLSFGLDNGINIIDTAEMYGKGLSESLVGDVIKNYDRDKIYLISKFLPQNASKERLEKALDKSLKRLNTAYLDLYLYHWRSGYDLSETVSELERLRAIGKIKNWGVSNFDTDDIKDLLEVKDGENLIANEVLYHLGSRGIEYDLKPLHNKLSIKTIAYCPLAQAGGLRNSLLNNKNLKKICKDKNISIYQLLLLFTLSRDNMISIPKSSSIDHLKELIACKDMSLTDREMDILNKEFPKPNKKRKIGYCIMKDIKKIEKMEDILKKHRKELEDFNQALDKFKKAQEDYNKLSKYYSSSDYMNDLEKSNKGEIDPSISQGIFSEDLVFDLIGENYQTGIKMLEIATDIIKNH